MSFPRSISAAFCLLSLATSSALAQMLSDQLSFGQNDVISPNLRAIPGWHVQGQPTPPQILRDKVILTPPAPGNRRAAMWTETRNPSEVWTASFSFRATGPERGGGNLELWYTAEGQDSIGTSSIYTVGKFDGLAITLDTHGGSAGMIRGFLNDGSIEYNKHHSVDALAFGHCQYAYRNLGRPSVLVIQQETTVFSVEIDGKSCFRSSEIKLPKDYFFGLSAASAETPDSFEAFGFKVTHDSTQFSHSNQQQPPAHQFTNPQGSSGVPAEAPASQYKTSEAQFADLHDRIQALSTQLSLLQGTFAEAVYKMGEGHEEVIRVAREPGSQFSSLETKVGNIERTLYKVQADVEGKDYRGHLDEIHNAVREGHTSLMEGLPASMSEIVSGSRPRMGIFLVSMIVVQLMLAVAYVVYKRRRANAPKKFL